MTDDSDAPIWERVLAEDGAALSELWDRHHARVFRHLLASGFSTADAEEVTSAAYLELWRKRAKVRVVDDSIYPWLLVTARNLSRNVARAQRRYRETLSKLPPPSTARDPADIVAGQDDERIVHLRAALADAAPADATLLALTALDGVTVRAAAQALGLSESAAKMRLSRLRRRAALPTHQTALIEGSGS